MVVLNKYHDVDEPIGEPEVSADVDAPPSYETIESGVEYPPVNHKSHGRWSPFPTLTASPASAGAGPNVSSSTRSQHPPLLSSSWLSMPSFTSSRTSKQVRQTVQTLIRDLVLNTDAGPTTTTTTDHDDHDAAHRLLDSCATACQTYHLDLPTLLQAPSIEHRSALYWAIVNGRRTLLPALLARVTPLSHAVLSEIRLACLASANQALFQTLRSGGEQGDKNVAHMAPLRTTLGADALVLGTMLADEVSVSEMEGHAGEFAVAIQINLWLKRMRVSGRVQVEFIARGRIWSLTFFSPPTTARATVGTWQVALCLLEHSPPTFVDARLVVDLPHLTALPATQSSDLISLSPPPGDLSITITARSQPPTPASVSPSHTPKSKSKSKAPQLIEVRLKSTYRLAHRASNAFLTALDAAFSSQKEWSSPRVEQWSDDGGAMYTNAIVVPLDDGAGAELLYDNTPFIAADGALHVRLEARLGKPDAPDCVIC